MRHRHVTLVLQYGVFPLLDRQAGAVNVHPLRNTLVEAHALAAQHFLSHAQNLVSYRKVVLGYLQRPVGPDDLENHLRNGEISAFFGIMNRQQGIGDGPSGLFVAEPLEQALGQLHGYIIAIPLLPQAIHAEQLLVG